MLQTLIEDAVSQGETTAVSLSTCSSTGKEASLAAGCLSPDGRAITVEDRFLVASITKPVVASACMLLAGRGLLSINDRVADYLPEFRGPARRAIQIRHLLSHTSGLPDMWSDNMELRSRHATLDGFVASGCLIEPATRPGQVASYSSVGFSLLGALLEQVARCSLRQLLAREIFEPLAMHSTSLGLDGNDSDDNIVEIRVPEEQLGTDWNWNSRYWRELGAPWGGLISTATDLTRFACAVAGWSRDGLFSPVLRDAMWTNQVTSDGLSGATDSRRGWGLGWRMNWPDHAAALCELLPESVVGHYGATGTVLWISADRAVVILTSEPALKRPRLLQRISNAIACARLD